ncbi:hypothetical protein Droror1_Dr00020929 [Drosera rotundifolia]
MKLQCSKLSEKKKNSKGKATEDKNDKQVNVAVAEGSGSDDSDADLLIATQSSDVIQCRIDFTTPSIGADAIDFKNSTVVDSGTVAVSTLVASDASVTDGDGWPTLWHRRLGHISERGLRIHSSIRHQVVNIKHPTIAHKTYPNYGFQKRDNPKTASPTSGIPKRNRHDCTTATTSNFTVPQLQGDFEHQPAKPAKPQPRQQPQYIKT